MDVPRTSLDKLNKKTPYLLFAIIFIILTLLAVVIFYQINNRSLFLTASNPVSFPTPTPSPSSTLTPIDTTPSATPTATMIPTATPTPNHLTFVSQSDKFQASYPSNWQLNQDQQALNNRYTFYLPPASVAVHVGSDWSWSHPGRQFSPTFKVDNHDTFRYDINLQTIVDIDKGELKYTIQCIHNADDDIKTQCLAFFTNFKFL